ncbi:WD40 repeat domain-containing protein [Mesorhizobium sp. LjNodule214]|uniref:WD40 repeat domain-containing protein n=1 Tax=Mesorhizobium sp. LjNodule214 TaxID=3342252 RepID=UPI003ED13796
MNRSVDRLLAFLVLAVSLACLAHVYLLPGTFVLSRLAHPLADAASLRLVAFLAAALVCALGALLFWQGRLPGRPGHQTGAPLFGRAAEAQVSGRPRLRLVFLVLPMLAVLALLADQFGPWRTGGEVPAPGEPKDVASAPPQPVNPPPATPAPAPVAPAPVTPPPEQAAKAPPPAEPAPVTPPSALAPAAAPEGSPKTALAPAPPLAAPPPQTVAPPPPSAPPRPTQPDGHRDAVVWLAVAADGNEIMSASTDRTIKLWDIDGKRLIRDLGVHKDMARTALFMPDGKRALTAGDDGEIVLRQLSDGAVLHVFSSGQNGGVRNLAISPDGRLAVSGHDTGSVIVWDIDKGSVLHVLPGHDWSVSAVAVSPDGTRAISGSIDGELNLWDIVSGKQLRSWHGHEQGTYGAVFTARGRHAVTGSGDYTIKLWDLDTFKEVRRFEGHSGTVYEIALSSDGKRLASVSLDGTARLWNMDTGDQIAEFDPGTGPLYSVAFAADGTLLTGGYDRTIRDWPAAGGDGEILFAGAPE